jgi:hypothetical protein
MHNGRTTLFKPRLCAVLFLVSTGPPLMGRPAATPGLIDIKPGLAYGRRPKQQGCLHWGLVAGGQSVAEL